MEEKFIVEIRIRRKFNFLPWSLIKPIKLNVGKLINTAFPGVLAEDICRNILQENKNVIAARWNWKK